MGLKNYIILHVKEFDKDIKDFSKPRKGKIKQGYFYPKNPDKYRGDLTKIIYRSSWEHAFLRFCDNTPAVLQYEIEPFPIAYRHPITRRVHKYFVDFYVQFKNGDTVKNWLVEIKPLRHTMKPTIPKRKTEKSKKNYKSAYERWQVNISKFKAADEFAHLNELEFDVVDMVSGRFKIIHWKKQCG